MMKSVQHLHATGVRRMVPYGLRMADDVKEVFFIGGVLAEEPTGERQAVHRTPMNHTFIIVPEKVRRHLSLAWPS